MQDWIHQRLKEINIRPQKKLGQNFLINEAIAFQIIQSLKELKPKNLVEIGPGLGSLTEHLISLEIPLTLVEVDPSLCSYWKKRNFQPIEEDTSKNQDTYKTSQEDTSKNQDTSKTSQEKTPHFQPIEEDTSKNQDTYKTSQEDTSKNQDTSKTSQEKTPQEKTSQEKTPHYQLIQKDALKIEWNQKCNLIGSLPFHIASSLIIQASLNQHVENMVFMVQKEVGDRVLSLSQKKDYGFLSVICQCFWKVKHLTDVKREDFFPSPKVMGQVLVFYQKNPLSIDHHKFLKFVKMCFNQRRKFLKKKLLQSYNSQAVEKAFTQMNLPPSTRAQELKPQEYLQFFKLLD